MFSPLRNRFGIPGAISMIALVFAMFGGAYAASNNGGKATASKAKAGPRGPRGKAGPVGPAGPQGPTGANGKDGTNGLNGKDGAPGEDGKDGTNGTNGKDGKSILVGEFTGPEEEPPNAGPCTGRGGSEFEPQGGGTTVYACNGEAGEDGENGGGTLESGETETGTWSFITSTTGEQFVTVSFPRELSAGLGEGHVHVIGSAGNGTTCPGNATHPSAQSGQFCLYEQSVSASVTFGEIGDITFAVEGTSKFGALVSFNASTTPAHGYGSWAVTG